MLSLNIILIQMIDRASSDYIVTATYDCFSSTITDTGHTNKTAFLDCIDKQNMISDQLSDIFLAVSFMLIITNILSYFIFNKK